MTYTLFDLTYRACRALGGIVTEGTFTAELADTVNLGGRFADDYFNEGTVWILRDSAGAGAAPEGQFQQVSDYVDSSGQLSIHTAFSVNSASGDRYAVASKKFPIQQLISKVNEVLGLEKIRVTDTTTIDTAAQKTEYTLPAALLDERIRVWIQRVTGDANDNRWAPYHDWYLQETGTGTAKTLVTMTQPPYAFDMKIEYWIPHPPLYVYTDELREGVNVDKIAYHAAMLTLEWRMAEFADTDPDLERKINALATKAERAAWQQPRPTRRPRLASFGIIDSYATDTETPT